MNQAAQQAANSINQVANSQANLNRLQGQVPPGQQIPTSAPTLTGEPAKNILQVIGRTTAYKPGVTADETQLLRAQDSALKALRAEYQGWNIDLTKLDTTIDAHTGMLRVQAKATRELRNAAGEVIGVQQQLASAFADPLNPESFGTSLTVPQQRVVQAISPMGTLDPRSVEIAEQAIGRYGYNLQEVISVTRDAGSAVTRFSAIAADGFTQATFHVDRFGNVTQSVARNAQTLLANVERNITKVVEWSIATGLVYGVMASIPAAARGIQDIEEVFTDIAVATGASQEALENYYRTALDVANATGTDVATAMEAQQKALRATANLSNQAAVSTQLLTDSLILASISGMSNVDALDTLLGALRQTGMELDRGVELLDKWVAVSKNAGVSVEDLAESFAITATAAETAGVSMDELNGLVAVLAENTTLSATEVGNAIRTIVSNITAPEAMQQLEQFGVSVRDVNGELRTWTDITQNIVDLMNAGVLNDEQINKLANALGGGSRRGPQVLAIWENFARVGEISEVSMNASGDAADAMALKIQTLERSIVELGNAFNELIKSLGFEGGFLDLLKTGVNLITDFVSALTDLSDSMGGSLAGLAQAFALYTVINRATGGGGILSGNAFAGVFGMGTPPGQMTPGLAQTFGRRVQGSPFSSWSNAGRTALQGVTGPGLAVIGTEIVRGIQGQEGAWGRVGGSIAGAIVGNMILPGAGGLIGAVIGDAFVSEVQSREEAFRAIALGAPSSSQEAEQRITDAFSGTFREFGSFTVPRDLREQFSDLDMAKLVAEAAESGAFQQAMDIQRRIAFQQPFEVRNIFREAGFSEQETQLLEKLSGAFSPRALEKLQKAWNDYQLAVQREAELVNQTAQVTIPQVFKDIERLATGGLGTALSTEFTGQRQTQFEESMIGGDLSSYSEFVNSVETVTNLLPQLAVALDETNMSQEEYIALGNTLVSTTEEARGELVRYISAVIDARAELERLQNEDFVGTDAQRAAQESYRTQVIQEQNEFIDEQESKLRNLLDLAERQVEVERARTDYLSATQVPEGATREMAQSVIEQARIDQREFAEFLGIDESILIEALAEPMILAYEEGFERVEGLIPDFHRNVIDALSEMAEEAAGTTNFMFRDLSDMDASMSGQLQQRINQYDRLLQQHFGDIGFDEEIQNIGVRFENNQFRELTGTATAMQLALEEILEVEKKQLEGFWNLPAGVTAYVPISSLFATQQDQGLGNLADLGPIQGPIEGTERVLQTELPVQTTLLRQMLGRTGLAPDDVSFAELQERGIQRRLDALQTDTPTGPSLGRTGLGQDDIAFSNLNRSIQGLSQVMQRGDNRPINLQVNVRNEPTRVNLQIDGRTIANAVTEPLVRRYRQQIRSGGLLPGGIRVQ